MTKRSSRKISHCHDNKKGKEVQSSLSTSELLEEKSKVEKDILALVKHILQIEDNPGTNEETIPPALHHQPFQLECVELKLDDFDNNSSTEPPFSAAFDKSQVDAIKFTKHCAYCLKECESTVIKCGNCNRRTYCSQGCQKLDWLVNGKGQRHVNWCGRYEYGEEDLDWEVVPIPNKGLGIRAKRFLPAGFRIIVEPVFTDPVGHPAIMDLAPVGGTLREKFLTNAIAGHPERDDGRPYIALRISRLNHNCRPNAANYSDEVARVDVLYALCDIQPGEEICISYTSFSDISLVRQYSYMPEVFEYSKIQKDLISKWGIKCAKDCYCKNPDAWAMIREGRKLGAEIKALAEKRKINEALRKGDQLLDIHQRLNESWLLRARTQFELYQIAKKKPIPDNIAKAREHLRATCDTYQIICPFSATTKHYERLMKEK